MIRSLFLVAFFCVSLAGFSQSDLNSRDTNKNKVEERVPLSDSERKERARISDSIYDAVINQNERTSMDRNLDSLMSTMREREKKQKRDAMIRIGIGVFFAVILIVGLARRRKKK